MMRSQFYHAKQKMVACLKSISAHSWLKPVILSLAFFSIGSTSLHLGQSAENILNGTINMQTTPEADLATQHNGVVKLDSSKLVRGMSRKKHVPTNDN